MDTIFTNQTLKSDRTSPGVTTFNGSMFPVILAIIVIGLPRITS